MLVGMDEGTSSPATAGQDIAGMSFEQALAALEAIVQQLERGDVPLDQSISLYERGEALRAACQQRLDAAQARIERIVTAADGRATGTRPFDTEG
jgi:exodeoxyribonuclease VII small subunit